MSTTSPVTATDLLARSGDGHRYELIAGELKMMSPSGWRHGQVVGNLHTLLGGFVRQRRLGRVFGAETGFLISRDPDTVRAPDIAFIATQIIPSELPRDAYWPGAPDLAVEVLSPNDRTGEVDQKISTWLTAGAEVWVVDPEMQTVTTYQSPTQVAVATGGETLSGGELLPDFTCLVDEIFEYPHSGRQPEFCSSPAASKSLQCRPTAATEESRLSHGMGLSGRLLMLHRLLLLLVFLGGAACGGCHLMHKAESWAPFPYQARHECLVLHSDFVLPERSRLVNELVAQRDILAEKLHLPRCEQDVHVYLFADEASYYGFVKLRFPEFGNRRAMFVGTETELAVYAHWGDYVAEDLRHEITHGYLHAVVPHVPLWLDEGLAEYFEVGRGRMGVNAPHVEYLSNQSQVAAWRPDLARLEALHSATDLTQQDYAEAWAWVHYLLESPDGKSTILTDYLDDLRKGASHARLSTSLGRRLAHPELALAEHIDSLR